MKGQLRRVHKTLRHPDTVKRSLRSGDTILFYKWYPASPVTEKFMVVVVKRVDGEGLILTAYYTDRAKPGETVCKRQEIR